MIDEKKQEAIQRAILRFMPKKKRGFLTIGASVILPAELNRNYIPWKKAIITGYEITNKYGLVAICMPYPNAAFTVKFKIENIYHSITDYIKSNYNDILKQLQELQIAFQFGRFVNDREKEKTRLVICQLINAKRRIEAVDKKKNRSIEYKFVKQEL